MISISSSFAAESTSRSYSKLHSDLNYEDLEATIIQGSKLEENDYSIDSWEYFQTVLDDAKILNSTRDAYSQEEIDELDYYLQESIYYLELRSDLDYSDLEYYINYAKGLDESRYDYDSWSDLEEALDYVTPIVNLRNADSQYTINDLTSYLIGTILDLVFINNPDKHVTILLLNVKTITKGESTHITVKLFDADGPIANELIKISINNKEYTVTTNENGIAVFKIKGINPGKYDIVAIYEGSNDYAISTATGIQVVKGIADLKITKVKKTKQGYKITLKNQGSANSGKFILKLYCGCKKYINIWVNSLTKGKSITKVVKFYGHDNHAKYAIANYKKKVLESNYKNNKVKI